MWGACPSPPPKTIIFVRASTPNIAVIYIIKYISVPTANSIFIIDGGAGVYVRHPLNICTCQNQLVVATLYVSIPKTYSYKYCFSNDESVRITARDPTRLVSSENATIPPKKVENKFSVLYLG